MKERLENFELKLYELLGIKHFRNLAFMLRNTILRILHFRLKKEEFNELLNTNSSNNNYTIDKSRGINGFINYKKAILLNTFIHLFSMIVTIFDLLLGSPITLTMFTVSVLNVYCLMLQRYNWIRINRIIKRGEKREKRQKEALLEDLKEINSEIDKHSYKREIKPNKEEMITYDDFTKEATLNHLRQYKTNLENMKIILEYLKEREKQDNLEIILPKNKQKILDINFKGL